MPNSARPDLYSSAAWGKAVLPFLKKQGFRGTLLDVRHAADEVCYGARKSAEHGYVVGPGGNWSCRLAQFMVIKGTGHRAESLTAFNNAIVNLKTGEPLDLPKGLLVKPSCEWPMHLEVLRTSTESMINAVCHTHCAISTAFATIKGAELYPNTPDFVAMLKTGEKLPKIPYIFPASTDLAAAVSKFTSAGHFSVLMANHGLITAAPNMTLAFDRTMIVETAANTYVAMMVLLAGLGKAIGSVAPKEYSLDPEQCAALLGSGFEKLRQQMADRK